MKKTFLLSRYEEDYNWIKEYTNDYIVYNKGKSIKNDSHIFNTENIGGNQRDIFHFIWENYEKIPDIMIFIQAFPFDHCKKEVFDKLIENNKFTSLEYYGNLPANDYEARTKDGKFLEYNNNWYINAHNYSHNQTCKYKSFDEFMNKYFEDYQHLEWIRFSPGSQYIIEDEQAKQYPKNFWKCLMNELNSKSPTEGHIIERALYHIFVGTYKLRREFYE